FFLPTAKAAGFQTEGSVKDGRWNGGNVSTQKLPSSKRLEHVPIGSCFMMIEQKTRRGQPACVFIAVALFLKVVQYFHDLLVILAHNS
ncbi:MAG: hypothetical protein DIU68_011240, partial [Chloroflexota bacterium]